MERGITPSIPPGKIHLTYVDYCELPDNGKQYEILEGELWMGPAPTPRHQSISANMFRILDQYLKAHPQGRLYYAPLDVILADDTIVQPDLVFVRFANLPRITTRGVEGAPDLVWKYYPHRQPVRIGLANRRSMLALAFRITS